MRPFSFALSVAVLASVALAGCAGDGTSTLLTTNSVPETTAPKKVSAADAACIALREKIGALRADGTVERVEKAGQGKTRSVTVKRASLQKVAELNQANAEFQAKCSKLPVQAAAPRAAAPKKVAAVTPTAAPAKATPVGAAPKPVPAKPPKAE